MLLKTSSAVIFLLAFLMPASGDLVVKYVVEISGEHNDFVFKLREGKARADYTDLSLLVDPTSNKFSYLSHHDKTFSQMNGGNMLMIVRAGSSIIDPFMGQTEMMDFKPTGITQKIDGYKTQEFVGSLVGGRLTVHG